MIDGIKAKPLHWETLRQGEHDECMAANTGTGVWYEVRRDEEGWSWCVKVEYRVDRPWSEPMLRTEAVKAAEANWAWRVSLLIEPVACMGCKWAEPESPELKEIWDEAKKGSELMRELNKEYGDD
jgi:hypothetical protein